MRHAKRSQRRLDVAFTLIEMMVITAIVGLLASALVPVLV